MGLAMTFELLRFIVQFIVVILLVISQATPAPMMSKPSPMKRLRFKVPNFEETFIPPSNPSAGIYFGKGYDPILMKKFQEEREKHRIAQGGFFLPSACPGIRPYSFYCDPRVRTGPINPLTGKPWPNGIYFPRYIPSSKQLSTTQSPVELFVSSQIPNFPGRVWCTSLLCPRNGNKGYTYSGIDDVENLPGKSSKSQCGSLLCPKN